MRKLKLQLQMSIDGYIAGPNGEMDWMALPLTEDLNSFVDEIVDNIDVIVLGRKLAQGFIPYWASVAANPDDPEYTAGTLFTDTPKVVFSKTLDKSEWPNTLLAKDDLVQEIIQLKKQEGKDIYACGGANFVSALIKHGLVDEYFLFINPTALGNGMTIFKELDSKQNLALIKSTAFKCGIVVLHYEAKMS